MNKLKSTAWDEPIQPGSLLARFSYMFPHTGSERKRAYVFFRGWMPTFALMCEQIDALLADDKREFAWIRVREKFGAPSLSYQMRGRARHVIHAHRPDEVTRIACAPADSYDPSAIEIQEAILRGEVTLRQSCIVCGAHSIITNVAGPWASLCSEHRTSDFIESLSCGSVWTAAELRDELSG